MRAQHHGKSWAFTVNYSDDQEGSVVEAITQLGAREEIEFLVAEKEVAPTTQQKHIQGYLRLFKDSREQKVKSLLPAGAHIEKAKKTLQANYAYCTKEGTQFVTKGFEKENETKNAKRDRKAREILDAIEHLNEATFALRFPDFYLYHYEKYKTHKLNYQSHTLTQYNGDLKEKNFWVFGSAGTGKSKWAHSLVASNKIYSHNISKWWSGYSSEHQIIVFEDWPNDKQCLIQHLKIWADRYPFIGEIKGSALGISPNDYCLVITSNYSIDEAFTDEFKVNHEKDRAAIHRRFTEVNFDDLQILDAELDPPKFLQVLQDLEHLSEGNTADDPNAVSDTPLVQPPKEEVPPPPPPKHQKKNEYSSPGYYEIMRQSRRTEALIKRMTYSINYKLHQFNKQANHQDGWVTPTPSDSSFDCYESAFDEEE